MHEVMSAAVLVAGSTDSAARWICQQQTLYRPLANSYERLLISRISSYFYLYFIQYWRLWLDCEYPRKSPSKLYATVFNKLHKIRLPMLIYAYYKPK